MRFPWQPPIPYRPPEPPVIEETIQDERLWQQKWKQVAELAWAKGLFLFSDRRWRHLPKRLSRPFALGHVWSIVAFAAIYIGILTYAANPDLILPSVLFVGGLIAMILAAIFFLSVSVHPLKPPEGTYPPNPVARVTRILFACAWYAWLALLLWTAGKQLINYLMAL